MRSAEGKAFPRAAREGRGGRRGAEDTYREPDGDVGIGRVASAAGVLLITEGLDDDGVIECAYHDHHRSDIINQDKVKKRTAPAIRRLCGVPIGR